MTGSNMGNSLKSSVDATGMLTYLATRQHVGAPAVSCLLLPISLPLVQGPEPGRSRPALHVGTTCPGLASVNHAVIMTQRRSTPRPHFPYPRFAWSEPMCQEVPKRSTSSVLPNIRAV